MNMQRWVKIREFINRSRIGYFAPLIAAMRMLGKRRLNYVHQLRVVYRYAFGK